MKQTCKKKFQSPCQLQTTKRQLGLDSSIRHTQGWFKLIVSSSTTTSPHPQMASISQWYSCL